MKVDCNKYQQRGVKQNWDKNMNKRETQQIENNDKIYIVDKTKMSI